MIDVVLDWQRGVRQAYLRSDYSTVLLAVLLVKTRGLWRCDLQNLFPSAFGGHVIFVVKDQEELWKQTRKNNLQATDLLLAVRVHSDRPPVFDCLDCMPHSFYRYTPHL